MQRIDYRVYLLIGFSFWILSIKHGYLTLPNPIKFAIGLIPVIYGLILFYKEKNKKT